MITMAKSDPIGEKFYAPLASAVLFSDVCVWFAAIFSIVALQIDKATKPIAYDAVQTVFAFSVVVVFVVGLAARL
jgi:hypothetical protein